MKLKSLSVFFPVYNEEKNIPHFLKESLEVIPDLAQKYEIIIINDGSTDNSKKIAQEWTKKYKQVKLYSHAKNKGYGAALKTGFAKSKYKWVFFTDGDLQFRIRQLKKFLPHTDDYSVIIGYRSKRAEGKLRAFNARLFKLYVDVLFRLHVKDIDCAFKLLKADVIKSVPLISDGAFTSSEFLYKLKKKGFIFKQLSVDHKLRKYGTPTGNNFRVISKAFVEPLKLYLKIKFQGK